MLMPLIIVLIFFCLVPQAFANTEEDTENLQLVYDAICSAMQNAAQVGFSSADKRMEVAEAWKKASPKIFETIDKHATESGKHFYRRQAHEHFMRGYKGWPDATYPLRLYDACMGWHEESGQAAQL